MAEYPDFKHGAYGEIDASGIPLTDKNATKQAIVYIGTAPVHLVEGGAANVNVPMLINNIGEAKAYLGYSDNWADYTLCEAEKVHFEDVGVAPLVFINVLDPVKHKAQTGGTATLVPDNGRVKIANAEAIILDSLVVSSGGTVKTKGVHYTVSYDFTKKMIVISEKTKGSLGTSALSITYDRIDPSSVTEADVIGTTDNYGLNTGMYAIKNVYNVTGYVPAFIVAPGFSSIPAIHNAMYENSLSISKHWNAWMFVDMPILDTQGNALTLANAADWKNANGYNKDNEDVFFPLVKGTDGKHYHLSVLNTANFQALLVQNKGVPYMTGSNTPCSIIEDLYFTENVKGRVYDDEVINRCLNANGINSAAYVSGRWAIWGAQAGSYNQDDGTSVNVFDTSRMMLFYLTNDFQHRRNIDIDKPMTANKLKTIRAEEQERIDRLLGAGALLYGKAKLDGSKEAKSDIYSGDFRIRFEVTTTPLTKSLTATCVWTDDGYITFFDAMEEAVA